VKLTNAQIVQGRIFSSKDWFGEGGWGFGQVDAVGFQRFAIHHGLRMNEKEKNSTLENLWLV